MRTKYTKCLICKRTIYFKFEDGVKKAFDREDMPHSCTDIQAEYGEPVEGGMLSQNRRVSRRFYDGSNP